MPQASLHLHTGNKMSINTITQYIINVFRKTSDSETYGSSLEAYIISKNPQSTYDIEYLTKQYDYNLAINRNLG
jgi:hypothetical protein